MLDKNRVFYSTAEPDHNGNTNSALRGNKTAAIQKQQQMTTEIKYKISCNPAPHHDVSGGGVNVEDRQKASAAPAAQARRSSNNKLEFDREEV